LVKMRICIHRWSTIKRWSSSSHYNLIQRCRKCDTWIKREINYDEKSKSNLSINTFSILKKENEVQQVSDHMSESNSLLNESNRMGTTKTIPEISNPQDLDTHEESEGQ
jgi:hypothetical protein